MCELPVLQAVFLLQKSLPVQSNLLQLLVQALQLQVLLLTIQLFRNQLLL